MENRFRKVGGIACHSPPGDNGEYLRGFYCPSTYQLLCENLKKKIIALPSECEANARYLNIF